MGESTMKTREATLGVVVAAAASLGLVGGSTRAQQRGTPSKDEAVLVVDGVVREVFRSVRRDRVDYLVQIEVKRSEAGRTPREPLRVLVPAPGDLVYVHASDPQAAQNLAGGREPAAGGRRVVPSERSQVRAYLVPRARGGWEGTSQDWFDLTSDQPVAESPSDPAPAANEPSSASSPSPAPGPAPGPGSKSALAALGLSGEGLDAQGRFVIRVTSVERGGPAQRAGLEPGDVIVAANDAELKSFDQLDQLARQGGTLNLIVLDVNTSKGARVTVDLPRAAEPAGRPPVSSSSVNPAPNPTPSPAGSRQSLGISAEPVTVGPRTAMKVIGVEPGSPAEKAGIERGDVIVAANGAPVTGVEQLGAALGKSGPTLRLTVRDTRTGRDVPVDVNLGGSPVADPNPIPTDPKLRTGGGGRLGAVTELVFFSTEAAVKVTEVEPNSPAARAGLEPGDVITEANGKPVLHPQTLNEIVGQSGPVLKLVVVDPRSSQKTNVTVNLGDGR
jgi:serine protease Do